MPRVKSHKFSTGKYKLHWQGIRGLCEYNDPNDPGGNAITIDPTLPDFEKLEVIIHESLHAEFHALTEQQVTDAAVNIARLLQRVGFKLDHKKWNEATG